MRADLLAPYRPDAADPFDLEKAGHLWRRGGFGASLAERERSVRIGPGRAVEELFAVGEGDDVDAYATIAVIGEDVDRLRAYRMWRLLAGRARLRERMTLFWHGHFATSVEKVGDVGAMARQLETFDALGLGRFADLCGAIVRDPAMLRWLDADRSVKGRPNENLARELFELFTLGRGHYGERDVQEAARAMTGWRIENHRSAFVSRFHDDGTKRVLGREGRLGVDEVVAAAVDSAASGSFMARALLCFFVHPEPTDDEIEALAAVWREEGGDVAAVLRALLHSRLFFSSRARRSRVMDPLDFVVGTVRSLAARASPRQLADAASRLGQTLLAPPGVEGWPREKAWISSSTWLLRANFALELLREARFALAPRAAAILGDGSPRERLDRAILLLRDGVISPRAREALAHYVDGLGAQASSIDVLHALLALPEAQLL